MQWKFFRERRFWLGSLLLLIFLALSVPSFAQEGENYCRAQIAQTIEYNETIPGLIDSQIPVAFFCFNGERGDDVTVTVEVTDGRLIPVLFITDPVFNEEDLQNPLGAGQANREGGTAEAEFSIDSSDTYLIVVYGLENTLGTFDITIEAETSSIIGGGTDNGNDSSEETESPDEDGNNGGSSDPSDIAFGETNICRLDDTEFLEYGDSTTGELDGETLVSHWYCFEAQAGDVVTVEVGTESGDLVMVGLIADPFFDLTENTVFAVDVARNRSDSAEVQYAIPEDGDYLIWVQIAEGNAGEYYLELRAEAAVPLDCSAEPLSSLISQQWMLAPAEGEAPLVLANLTCDGQIAVSTMGAPEVGFFELDDAGKANFVYGNRLFSTVSFDATGWTIANSEGTEYSLVPVPDTNCADEATAALIGATWQYGSGEEAAYLSFTCNGIVVVNVQGQTGAQDYTFIDGTISINLGDDASIEFENVVIDGNDLNATLDGDEVSLSNVLAD
jgi:hypothetical protein